MVYHYRCSNCDYQWNAQHDCDMECHRCNYYPNSSLEKIKEMYVFNEYQHAKIVDSKNCKNCGSFMSRLKNYKEVESARIKPRTGHEYHHCRQCNLFHVNGRPVYPEQPNETAEFIGKVFDIGFKVVGGLLAMFSGPPDPRSPSFNDHKRQNKQRSEDEYDEYYDEDEYHDENDRY